MSATLASTRRAAPGRTPARRPGRPRRPAVAPTLVLLLGAVYCLAPVLWVLVAATKNNSQLFSTFTFTPNGSLWANIRSLSDYQDGIFWEWMLNSALYAGGGALVSAALSGLTGYTLAKYPFRGRSLLVNTLLAGVLVPGVVLAIPQYLLLAKVGLTNTYWSVLLPSTVSPFGIYLGIIYANAAVPDELIESARIDGGGEGRILRSIAVPLMSPGLLTIFLLQFVAIWNNFLLPFIMLDDTGKYPLTVGLYTMLSRGASAPALYTLVITGALLSILPLIALFLSLQRYWRVDLLSGSVKA
jgi:multiple sugar transport system permease protein